MLRAASFSSWNLDPNPDWEVSGILRFLEDPRVKVLEDPTNTPEEISGRGEEGGEGSPNASNHGGSTETSIFS